MASIGVVNADIPKTQEPMNTTERPKKIYFGVFFDGTGNNMIQAEVAKNYRAKMQTNKKDDDWDLRLNSNLNKYGANSLIIKGLDKDGAKLLSKEELDDIPTQGSGYSNVAILHGVYQGMSKEELNQEKQSHDVYLYNIYVEGVGTKTVNEGIPDLYNQGVATGDTGVVALVSKAVMMVNSIVQSFKVNSPELHFNIFGFSRGATCARLFAFLIARDGAAFGAEKEFGSFQAKSLYKDKHLKFLEENEFKNKTVDFLGIYDTVSSIGINHDKDVIDYGLYSPTLSTVKNTFHLCALDEFRENFRLTDIGLAANKGSNAEVFIPGCHSDVGGTYQLQSDDFTLVYLSAALSKTKIFVSNPNSKNGETAVVDAESLVKLGWAKTKEDVSSDLNNYTSGYITCTRKKILGGYSNIPLNMMANRAINKTQHTVFATFPAKRFDIPLKLKELGEEMLRIANSAKGREWFYPSDSYTSNQYKFLRGNFLHFSATDTIGKNVVNGPSRLGSTICRQVYYGNQSSGKPKYLCDYS